MAYSTYQPGYRSHRLGGAYSIVRAIAAAVTGSLLLEDGVSYLLLEDGVSRLLLE
jgi:hypothetical protein